MKKLEIQKRVLQNGKPLDLNKFTWDEKTSTFSTSESYLVLDFKDINNCSFNTGSGCTFDTGSYCTFDTGFDCSFITGSGCTFRTGSYCTFDTGFDCTFTVGEDCVVVRRDDFEVIQPKSGKTIKLNGDEEKGFSIIEEEKISIELTKEQLEKIKHLI